MKSPGKFERELTMDMFVSLDGFRRGGGGWNPELLRPLELRREL